MTSDTCSSRDTSTLPPFECPNAPPSWTLSLVYEGSNLIYRQPRTKELRIIGLLRGRGITPVEPANM